MKLYEGLFLIDNVHANTDWDNVVGHIHDILQKNGAEILKSEKWGERKLAYKIKGHKRGTYLLIHFNTKNTALAPIRRDLQLSDSIIRFLIIKDTKIEDVSQIGAVERFVEKDAGTVPEVEDTELLKETNIPAANTAETL
ncbi:MAG: 30S ribosomal protein S6 [Candidatus Loosdrechtia sp.]|uniref:30S ribosomal protein S6 n=1 Tax=Candidatus Loosdrechtia sp. TaxID=3101272 RepID=UPI003A71E280|nr:MAG: 30S ribosomal protein S6 [Candidatus Jettenia sp. AMX2]